MKLTVSRIKEKSNGNFSIKLEEKRQGNGNSVFGSAPTGVGEIFYIEVGEPSVALGQVLDVDLSNFEIVERTFTVDDESSDNYGQSISCRWLVSK